MTATYIICLRERVCVCEREREREREREKEKRRLQEMCAEERKSWMAKKWRTPITSKWKGSNVGR